MAAPKTPATGWIGSKFVGVPGQPAASPVLDQLRARAPAVTGSQGKVAGEWSGSRYLGPTPAPVSPGAPAGVPPLGGGFGATSGGPAGSSRTYAAPPVSQPGTAEHAYLTAGRDPDTAGYAVGGGSIGASRSYTQPPVSQPGTPEYDFLMAGRDPATAGSSVGSGSMSPHRTYATAPPVSQPGSAEHAFLTAGRAPATAGYSVGVGSMTPNRAAAQPAVSPPGSADHAFLTAGRPPQTAGYSVGAGSINPPDDVLALMQQANQRAEALRRTGAYPTDGSEADQYLFTNQQPFGPGDLARARDPGFDLRQLAQRGGTGLRKTMLLNELKQRGRR